MGTGIEVVIGGVSYPCRLTMGAMRRYKRISGQEVTEMDLSSISSVAELLWCCVASACNADKVAFDMSLDDFCDALDATDMEQFSAFFNGETAEGAAASEEKKRA